MCFLVCTGCCSLLGLWYRTRMIIQIEFDHLVTATEAIEHLKARVTYKYNPIPHGGGIGQIIILEGGDDGGDTEHRH